MKTLSFAIVFLFLFNFDPARACLAEAQFIAKVQGTQVMGEGACFVALEPASVRFYQENMTCPLDLAEVIQGGIQIPAVAEDGCSFKAGDDISGVIVKTQDGSLILE